MTTAKRQRFITGVTAWMVATVIVLTALGSIAAELFFVLSLIGFLVVVELTAPINVTPRWRRRLLVVVGLGIIIFGGIVLRRVVSILQEEGTLPEELIQLGHLGGI